MRTNIDIDDKLMESVMKSGGFKTKKAAVEEALKLMQQRHAQGKMIELFGKLHWEGDLEDMRTNK